MDGASRRAAWPRRQDHLARSQEPRSNVLHKLGAAVPITGFLDSALESTSGLRSPLPLVSVLVGSPF